MVSAGITFLLTNSIDFTQNRIQSSDVSSQQIIINDFFNLFAIIVLVYAIQSKIHFERVDLKVRNKFGMEREGHPHSLAIPPPVDVYAWADIVQHFMEMIFFPREFNIIIMISTYAYMTSVCIEVSSIQSTCPQRCLAIKFFCYILFYFPWFTNHKNEWMNLHCSWSSFGMVFFSVFYANDK